MPLLEFSNDFQNIQRAKFCNKDSIFGAWKSSVGVIFIAVSPNLEFGCNFAFYDFIAIPNFTFIWVFVHSKWIFKTNFVTKMTWLWISNKGCCKELQMGNLFNWLFVFTKMWHDLQQPNKSQHTPAVVMELWIHDEITRLREMGG